MKTCLKLMVCLLLLLAGCDKNTMDDLSGDETMYGRLLLVDPVSGAAEMVPMAKKTVVIRLSGAPDQVNYLFSTKTDDQGYFRFGNLKAGTSYSVDYQETVGGIMYAADANSQVPSSGIAVVVRAATGKQNVVIFTLKDDKGNLVKETDICVFADATSFGYVNGSCDGSSYTVKTDAQGRALLFGIPSSANYHVFAKKTFGDVVYAARLPLSLNMEVREVALVMAPVPLTVLNGLAFKLTDPYGNLVKDADIFLFTGAGSPGYMNGTGMGSSYQLKTDASGQAKFQDLPQGTYYVLAIKEIDKVPMLIRATVSLGAGVVSTALGLVPETGVRFVTTDVSGQPIGNVDVCVFSSKILFDRGGCDGNSFNLKTGTDGQHALYKLPRGTTYYVYASIKLGNEVWSGKQTVVVGNQLSDCVLQLVKQ